MSRHTHAQFSIMTNISSIIQTLAFTLIILTPSLCQAFWTSTHYNTLNVDSQASKKEIKSAYRKLALKYHPDRNSDESAKQQFLEISKAYEVLTHAEKRRKYDKYSALRIFRDRSAEIFVIFGHFRNNFWSITEFF